MVGHYRTRCKWMCLCSIVMLVLFFGSFVLILAHSNTLISLKHQCDDGGGSGVGRHRRHHCRNCFAKCHSRGNKYIEMVPKTGVRHLTKQSLIICMRHKVKSRHRALLKLKMTRFADVVPLCCFSSFFFFFLFFCPPHSFACIFIQIIRFVRLFLYSESEMLKVAIHCDRISFVSCCTKLMNISTKSSVRLVNTLENIAMTAFQ